MDEVTLKEVLMIDELSIVETDKVNHTVEMDILKLVVEVKCFGKCVDEFDKVTVVICLICSPKDPWSTTMFDSNKSIDFLLETMENDINCFDVTIQLEWLLQGYSSIFLKS
ncbi:hypothetical protein Tco_1056017 [Tanacetum coccineum]|uniref:Uncharacterized protein n=1 Tax=Tanacetum coccineum TaxID=301880 RepID=A0ABQ5H2S6_9ASTR